MIWATSIFLSPASLTSTKNFQFFIQYLRMCVLLICSNFQLKTWSPLFETSHLTSNFLTKSNLLHFPRSFTSFIFGFVAIHHSRSGMSRELLWRGGGWDGDTLHTIEKITKPESRVKQSTKRNLQDIICSIVKIKSSSRAGIRRGSPSWSDNVSIGNGQ